LGTVVSKSAQFVIFENNSNLANNQTDISPTSNFHSNQTTNAQLDVRGDHSVIADNQLGISLSTPESDPNYRANNQLDICHKLISCEFKCVVDQVEPCESTDCWDDAETMVKQRCFRGDSYIGRSGVPIDRPTSGRGEDGRENVHGEC